MTTDQVAVAAIGGALIGVSALLLMLFNGRIAGICGILAAAVLPGEHDRGWRWLFLLGLPSGALLWHLATGTPVPQPSDANPLLVLTSGLIVGIGTRLGSGCTSGHGVCGIARLSRRSFVATLLFMGAGALTVALVRHLGGG